MSKSKSSVIVVDLIEIIEKLFEERPKGTKKKELKAWKEDINKSIEQVNKATKTKIYNLH